MRYNQTMPNNDGQQTVKYCRINVRLQSQNDTQPMRRNRQTKRIQVLYLPMLMLIRRIIGAFFLILGIIGLLMPIIPVYLSIILGIALLGSRFHAAQTQPAASLRLLSQPTWNDARGAGLA